jgi:hypothetical protein
VHAALARPVELAEEDRLRMTEQQLAAGHDKRLRVAEQRRLDVPGSVARPVDLVMEVDARRHEPVGLRREVGRRQRVEVRVDGQAGGRVRQDHHADALVHAAPVDDCLHLRGDVDHLRAGLALQAKRVEHGAS